jgi:curli biogenesis system outer membrane secretion channel CsgG
MMKKTILVAVMAVAMCFSAAAQSVTTYVLYPPTNNLTGVKKISILEFEGKMGTEIVDYLTAKLLQEYRGTGGVTGSFLSKGKPITNYQKGARTNVFSLVERGELDKILREQNISNSGLIDDSQAAEVGKLLGIDAMLMGSVTYSSKDEQSTSSYTDKNGAKHYSYCTKRTVSAEANMKIINVNTGQIMGTTVQTSAFSDQKCDENRSGLLTVEAIAKVCYDDLADKLANYFCPGFVATEFEFEKIKDKEYKDKAKSAMDYIEIGDLNNAFSIYKSIHDIDPYNSASACNIAQLYEIVGNYEKALEYYNFAAEVDAVAYTPKVQYAQKEIEMAKALEALGVVIEKTDFTQKSDALAEKVTTRGSKSDKYDVRVNPDEISDVVAKVPGDTEFTVIEQQGEYYLIKLLGGKQGFIKSDYVK